VTPATLPEPFDGYEILEMIGRGGMSVVYKARQAKLNRSVALKMLLAGAHASPTSIARLKAESELIAGLRHPSIVKIHDVGEHQGVPYLCLELIQGGSLADRLAGQPIQARQAARLVSILASVVQSAHEHGVIHRDLKPANVLIDHPLETSPDQWQRLMLTDFGLAKRLDGECPGLSTRTGDVLGTPAYMAPEQVMSNNGRNEPLVDVYGLGAIFYELLTGRPPFRGASPFETALQVISQPPEPPRSLNIDIPASLEAICLRCLEKDPGRRPASTRAVADEIEAYPRGILVRKLQKRRVLSLVGPLMIFAVVVLAVAPARWRRPVPVRPDPVPRFEGLLPVDTTLEGTPYDCDGNLVLAGFTDLTRPKETVIRFDLCNRHKEIHEKHYVDSLTRNALIFDETYFQVRYWRPIDERDWAEVVYRFEFDFPVRSASLYASVSLAASDSQGELQVTADASRGWTTVRQGHTAYPYSGHIPISAIVRGSRTIFVKARVKGRDDGEDSSLAQFLRSSTRDGDPDLHNERVFELRASAEEIPFVKVEAKYETGAAWVPIRYDGEGRFRLNHLFPREDAYDVRLRATVNDRTPVEETRRVWVTTPGCEVVFNPPLVGEIKTGEIYRSKGRVRSDPTAEWRGSIDYGDGSTEQPLTTDRAGMFALEHRFARAGKHFIYLVLRDSRGRLVVGQPTCLVSDL
jgi:serine/threonine-protein kinase